MRANEYELMRHAVEEGVRYGWRRAYKHRDDEPSEEVAEVVIAQIQDHVVSSICEWFIFSEPDDEK